MKPFLLVFERWEHTVPNFITVFRLILCLWGLHVFYWFSWFPPLVLLLCLVSTILDGVDGYFARLLKQESFSGKVLDPLVDKVCCWNLVFVLAHYFITLGDGASQLFMLLALPPLALIALYDYATMSMRASDENMVTSDTAKWKQGTLFTALGLFLFAMTFRYAAEEYGSGMMKTALYWTYSLFLLGGVLGLWQALRMTAESTRVYFANSKDPRAKGWAAKPLVRFVLNTI